MPGNTGDATVLLPVVDRLRERFHISRVYVVVDRGMISAATIAALEAQARIHSRGPRAQRTVVRRLVLDDEQPFTPLLVERAWGETQLFVKEFRVCAARYVLCCNEAEAEREPNERQAIVAGFTKRLARRQGADRQLRLPPLPAGGRQTRPASRRGLRDRSRQIARGAHYDGLFVRVPTPGSRPTSRTPLP
jgi:hypothetical protein